MPPDNQAFMSRWTGSGARLGASPSDLADASACLSRFGAAVLACAKVCAQALEPRHGMWTGDADDVWRAVDETSNVLAWAPVADR